MSQPHSEKSKGNGAAHPETCDRSTMTMKRCKQKYLKLSDSDDNNLVEEGIQKIKSTKDNKGINKTFVDKATSTIFAKVTTDHLIFSGNESNPSSSTLLPESRDRSSNPLSKSPGRVSLSLPQAYELEKEFESHLSTSAYELEKEFESHLSTSSRNVIDDDETNRSSYMSFHEKSYSDYESSRSSKHSDQETSIDKSVSANENEKLKSEEERKEISADSINSSGDGQDFGKEDEVETGDIRGFSPWGEPHRDVDIPAEFFNRPIVNSYTPKCDDKEDGNGSGGKPVPPDPVNDNAREHNNNIQNFNTPPASSTMAAPPVQLAYQVYPLFPVYLVNSVQLASPITSNGTGNGSVSSAGQSAYNVNVVTLPPANFIPVVNRQDVTSFLTQQGAVAGLSPVVVGYGAGGRPEYVMTRPAGLGNRDNTNNMSESVIRAHDKPIGRRPMAVICYICGKEYGTASIGIHEKQCLEKWRRENPGRKKEPVKPPAFPENRSSASTSQATTSTSDKDRIPGTGRTSYDLSAINDAAFASAQSQYVACKNCGRTFAPDRLGIHSKNCRGFHKIVQD